MRRPVAVLVIGLAAALGLGGLVARRAPSADRPVRMDPARLSAAIDYFELALRRDPANPMLKGQLVSRLIMRFGQTADLADVTRAESLAASGLSLAADTSGGLARLSGLYLMQHNFGAAFEAAARAVAADTGSDEARGTLLEAALAAGRYEVADRVARQITEASVAGLARRALWLDAEGRTDAALRLMTAACRELERTAAPAQTLAWCLTQTAGMIHSIRGPDDAGALLHRVLELDPGNRGGVEGLANLGLSHGRYREALDRFQSIRSAAHPDLYLRIAEAYRHLDRPDSAAAFEEQFLAVAGGPANEALFGNALALFYAERRGPSDLDSALAIAEREVVRRPTNESHDLLAWIHFRRGAMRAALAASERSLRWGQPNPTMLYHRSRILAALGRGEEANRALSEAMVRPSLLAPHARRDWARS